MIKVNFKETPNRPYKTVQRFNKVTRVTLQGKTISNMDITLVPIAVFKWLSDHPLVDNVAFGLDSIRIKAEGRAKKSDKDEDNPILAERIAESRAKIKIYKFMKTLCLKLFKYYCKAAFGYEMMGVTPKGIYGEIEKYDHLLIKEKLHLEDLLS